MATSRPPVDVDVALWDLVRVALPTEPGAAPDRDYLEGVVVARLAPGERWAPGALVAPSSGWALRVVRRRMWGTSVPAARWWFAADDAVVTVVRQCW